MTNKNNEKNNYLTEKIVDKNSKTKKIRNIIKCLTWLGLITMAVFVITLAWCIPILSSVYQEQTNKYTKKTIWNVALFLGPFGIIAAIIMVRFNKNIKLRCSLEITQNNNDVSNNAVKRKSTLDYGAENNE